MGLLSRLFGGSSKSSTSSADSSTKSTTQQFDNRVVLGNDALQVGAGAEYTRDSNNTTVTRNQTSFEVNDSSSRDYSNRSVTNNTTTDGGSVEIARFNSELLRSVSENQGDTVRLLASMGADGISKQAGAATDLFATAAENSTKSWTHTIDKSADLIDRLLMTAQGTIAGANAVATKAVDSFTPTANKQADAFKWAAIAAGVLIAFKLFKA